MGADGSNIRDAGGKGELQRFTPFRTLDGDRVECVGIDLIAGNEEIYLVGDIYPDIFLNLTNAEGNDRDPDWPANCLAGFEGAGSSVFGCSGGLAHPGRLFADAGRENPAKLVDGGATVGSNGLRLVSSGSPEYPAGNLSVAGLRKFFGMK